MKKELQHQPSFLPVFLPSVLLFSIVAMPFSVGWNEHYEVFGNEDYYLSLVFGGPSEGPLAPAGPVHFKGTLVSAEGESSVEGFRVRAGTHWLYQIQSGNQRYRGTLPVGACPAYLDFSPDEKRSKTPAKLRYGSCS